MRKKEEDELKKIKSVYDDGQLERDMRSPLIPDPCSLIPLHERKAHTGFTLVEMLVVIGIIAILSGAGIAAYSSAIRSAQRARATELVHDMQTALVQVLQKEDAWPPAILSEGTKSDGQMTSDVGAALVKRGVISGSYKEETVDGEKRLRMTGVDQFGILSPWAADIVKARINSGGVNEGTSIPSGGKLMDHRLRFAVDDDYDGITEVKGASGGSFKVRASACVWCCGFDGRWNTKDDVQSWSKDQEVK